MNRETAVGAAARRRGRSGGVGRAGRSGAKQSSQAVQSRAGRKMQVRFICWRHHRFEEVQSTVHARQRLICLSKMALLIGLSLRHSFMYLVKVW
jgi:hypothetical protein